MSRFGEDHDDDEDARVYVNNMNTREPTVFLPTHSRSRVASRLVNPGRGPGDNSPRAETRPKAGGVVASAVSEAQTVEELLGDALHPNLEQVYKRIMRKLQRQLNYEELSRVPLSEQFGINVQLEAEAATVHHDDEDDIIAPGTTHTVKSAAIGLFANDDNNNNMSKRSRRGEGGGGEAVKKSSTNKSNANNNSEQAALTTSGGAPAVGMAVRYQPTDGGATGKVARADESLAMQPCPRTLRLVVQHVQDTVFNKLAMGERGTLKECLRFSFECRALLDRLVKEIPTYTPFPDGDVNELPARGVPQRNCFRVQEMFQEFSKTPVPMPRGRFIQDAVTGEVSAELDLAQHEGLNRAQGRHAGFLPNLSGTRSTQRTPTPAPEPVSTRAQHKPGQSAQLGGIIATCTSAAEDVLGPQLSSPAGLQLPPGYGKSSRLAVPRETPEDQTSPLEGIRSQSPLGGTGPLGNTLLSLSRPCSAQESSFVARSSSSNSPLRHRRFVQSRGEAERRATQVHHVGTSTAENGTNVVTIAEYERMCDYAKSLEVTIAEMEQNSKFLKQRLAEETDYAAGKTGVIQYLRETLVRECNTLRSQVHFAAQREQQQLSTAPRTPTRKRQTMGPRSNTNRRQTTSISAAPLSSSTRALPTNNNNNNNNNTSMLEASSSLSVSAPRNFSDHFTPQQDSTTIASLPPPAVSIDNSASNTAINDITSIQSLLDLVLMAIEKDEVLPATLDQLKGMDITAVQSSMVKSDKKRADEFRANFEEKQRHLKSSLVAQKIKNGYIVAAKDKEIARLEKLTDLKFVQSSLQESIRDLRNEQRNMKNAIFDELQGFQRTMTAVLTSVANRSKVVDQSIGDYAAVKQSLSAMKDLIDSVYALFVPMMTPEYMHGYHPWPAKLRNTLDPLAHVIKIRYGPAEVVRLRDQLSTVSDIYLAIHKFVAQQLVIPDLARPSSGETLREISSRMALSPLANMDTLFQIRDLYNRERVFMRKIAKLNFEILWNGYRQTSITERCIAAMMAAGLDPQTTSMPISSKVNEFADRRGILTRERNALQKERLDNVKAVYRIWQEKRIDIWDGYAPPVVNSRLTILSEAEVSSSAARGSVPSVSTLRNNTRGQSLVGGIHNASGAAAKSRGVEISELESP